MRWFRNPSSALLICLGLAAGATTWGEAATLTSYPDEESFLAAIGSSFTSENFDGFEDGTVIDAQVTGVTFSSPNADSEGYFPIQAFLTSGASSPPNILAGGSIPGSPTPPQVIVMEFDPAIFGLRFDLSAQDPDATDVSVHFVFADESSQTLFIGDTDGSESTPEFFAVTSDTAILQVTLTSGLEDFGEGGFEEFGIDDLIFADVEQNPPDCSGSPIDLEGIPAIDGTATDDDSLDTGIASVALASGAENVTLSVDPDFTPGVGLASFLATQTNPLADSHGTVVVTDGADNICTLSVTFHALPAGPTENEIVCSGEGILLSVSNDTDTLAGTSACSTNTPSVSDPAFPPGYEPSPPEDPFPCRVCTILSPISGSTKMVYKKDGAFEPRLRLLYSHLEDGVFTPFSDVTESVEEIATVSPDPTRASGVVKWSEVKVACALQNEICNGLDDDGDGAIDEGLPVGASVVDCDGDAFPLCPAAGTATTCAGDSREITAGTPADCNDQIATIHPNAPEACNGLDDDCDGDVDEGSPAGGAACTVVGEVGACAVGVTSCATGPLTCVPAADPSVEVCDGIDNDCDGLTDENLVLGDYLPPVNPDGSSIFRRKRTIPFKIRVMDCSGAIVTTATPRIQIFFYASGVIGSEVEDVMSPGAANTDNLYRLADDTYIYNLSTLTLSPSTSYLVRTTVDDGSTQDVVISIK
jgi:putative metal-binding protein